MRPVILLTCSGLMPSGTGGKVVCEADNTEARRDGLLSSYIDSVTIAGGAPLLLPNSGQASAVAASLEAADGLLLTGGGDVSAELYGQTNHPSMSFIDPLRDRTEQFAIGEALRRGLPILGICRGIQIVNVVLGGTLIQDIPSMQPGAIAHNGTHEVTVEPGVLRELWPRGTMTVNSFHHQAVDRLADGLKVAARAADGIIEAVESSDGGGVLAVQCHPERLSRQTQDFLAVFQWLIEAARKGRRPKTEG